MSRKCDRKTERANPEIGEIYTPFTDLRRDRAVRGWKARHQGGIQHQHLDCYLDEFTFRFSRRRSQARGLLFHRLAQQAVAVGPAPCHTIICAAWMPPPFEGRLQASRQREAADRPSFFDCSYNNRLL
jgi:hypothetical protein